MICSFCSQTVLGSARAWGFHRDAATQLARSTQERERCVLCRQLDNDVRRSATAQATATTTPHVYRWTLRPAPQIRESRRRVVLTFRPLPEFAQAGLPDRVFHFVPEEGDFTPSCTVALKMWNDTDETQIWEISLLPGDLVTAQIQTSLGRRSFTGSRHAKRHIRNASTIANLCPQGSSMPGLQRLHGLLRRSESSRLGRTTFMGRT